jgi:tetratricopeptide (TPR) repeat protein
MQGPPEFVALSPFYSRAHDRFTIALLHEQLKQTREAVRWYESLLDGYDFTYVAAAHQKLSRLYEMLGERDLARRHSNDFARLSSFR